MYRTCRGRANVRIGTRITPYATWEKQVNPAIFAVTRTQEMSDCSPMIVTDIPDAWQLKHLPDPGDRIGSSGLRLQHREAGIFGG